MYETTNSTLQIQKPLKIYIYNSVSDVFLRQKS